MKSSLFMQSLLVASLAVLSACGGDDGPATPAKCHGATCETPVPNPSHGQGDYMATSVLPQLQQQYGSLVFFQAVTIMKVNIPAGTHTWANVYSLIVKAAQSSGCIMTSTPYASQGALGSLNYNCFQSQSYSQMQIWSSTLVQFEFLRHSNQYLSAFELINWFLGTASSSSQVAYTQQYGAQNNFYDPSSHYYAQIQQQYGYAPSYDPYWCQNSQIWNQYGYGGYSYGQYQAPYYLNNGGSQYMIRFTFFGG